MARPLRIEFPGGLYHVTSRGDRREEIYLDDTDRINWLILFGQACKRFNWVCHAYCLMDNYYHNVVETLAIHWGQVANKEIGLTPKSLVFR